MATSSIEDKFIIKDEESLTRLDEAFKAKSRFSNIKPLSDKELNKGSKIIKECLLHR